MNLDGSQPRLSLMIYILYLVYIEIDNLVQHSYYSFNVKLAGVPEIAHAASKEPAIDRTKLCVPIFKAMGFNIFTNDIDRAH